MNQRAARVALAVAVVLSGAVAVSSASEPDDEPPLVVPTITEVPYVAPTETDRPQQVNTPILIPPDPKKAPPTATPYATATIEPYSDWAVADYGPPWEVDCDDDIDENGYRHGEWARGFCVPGYVTRSSQFYESPARHWGLMTSYSPGVMENQVRYRGYDPNEVEGIALLSCNHIHDEVWLRIPGVTDGWEGPFVVVDCAGRNHIYYHQVGLGLVVEVSGKQAVEWGVLVAPYIEVSIGSKPGAWSGVRLATWWLENVLEWEGD